MTTSDDEGPPIDEVGPRAFRMVITLTYIALAVVVTVAISIGFSLSRTHRLQPNNVFGLRTEVTLSSAAGWYAAQKVGFAWALFGGVTVLLLGAILVALALAKRWSLMRIFALTTMSWLFFGVFLAIGFLQGESAAKDAIDRTNHVGDQPVAMQEFGVLIPIKKVLTSHVGAGFCVSAPAADDGSVRRGARAALACRDAGVRLPETVEASAMRSSDVRETKEVRPGVPSSDQWSCG